LNSHQLSEAVVFPARIATVAGAALLASAALTGMATAAPQSPAVTGQGSVWSVNMTGEGATYAIAENNAVLLVTEGPCIAKLPPEASGQNSNGTWWVTVHGICNDM
jgi:hypothetical protein